MKNETRPQDGGRRGRGRSRRYQLVTHKFLRLFSGLPAAPCIITIQSLRTSAIGIHQNGIGYAQWTLTKCVSSMQNVYLHYIPKITPFSRCGIRRIHIPTMLRLIKVAKWLSVAYFSFSLRSETSHICYFGLLNVYCVSINTYKFSHFLNIVKVLLYAFNLNIVISVI